MDGCPRLWNGIEVDGFVGRDRARPPTSAAVLFVNCVSYSVAACASKDAALSGRFLAIVQHPLSYDTNLPPLWLPGSAVHRCARSPGPSWG